MAMLFFNSRNPLAVPLFALAILLLADGALSRSLPSLAIGLISLAAALASRSSAANNS
ncbi:hypothetical protein M2401_000923 [Pseudomonas sp. JUb42]|jgi:hypothetical protein|uniref:hypothetical protein n=1 Tax=Pseudomonas sp. JUb42 TaxID=2940611 RepID=UPI00216A34F6|nr:hypothetical protein [Pseudomonas sp. JUb42]MCS3467202.1 hypothetical protein [Pseudomonas sp. JUb42]